MRTIRIRVGRDVHGLNDVHDPVGYQTNLFVYGPGGYTFSGFLRVGALSQFLLSSVTVRGIAFFWGVRV